MKSGSKILLVSILLILSSFVILDSSTLPDNNLGIKKQYISAQTELIEDSGFESGGFSIWRNDLDTSTNTIQSDIVHSGNYSLKMESVSSTTESWRPVWQNPSISTSLADNLTFTAAIYPLVTGITCGPYGQASCRVTLYDNIAEKSRRLIYVWSGYDFPGTDTTSNDTRGYFEFYQWSPSTWHILSRNLLVDYTACYGAPTNASEVTLAEFSIYNYDSNGEPGTFYADDIQITTGGEGLVTTTTNPQSNSTIPDISGILEITLLGSGIGIFVVVGVLVVLVRRNNAVESSQIEYNW